MQKLIDFYKYPKTKRTRALELFNRGNLKKYDMKYKAALKFYYKAYKVNPFTPDLKELIISILQILKRDEELQDFLKINSNS